jgi:hypothetical protein
MALPRLADLGVHCIDRTEERLTIMIAQDRLVEARGLVSGGKEEAG